MRRVRLLLTLVVLLGSLRWLPSGWCGREADALWADDVQMQRALAAGVDHWRQRAPGAARFMTDSDRFDGEWLFGTYMMAALGYLQIAQAHPELREESIVAADDCIDRLLTPEVRRFDREAWSSDPLHDLGTSRAHAAYLGYLNLAISLRRVLAPDSPHAEVGDRISDHLDHAWRRRRGGLLATYPDEIYPVDNAAVAASLALHERATGVDHSRARARWDDAFAIVRDPGTGLLLQSVTPGNRPLDAPRGSGTGLAAYFLSFSDREQSRQLYEAMRAQLHRRVAGFSAMREYPPGVEGSSDIDSGPLIGGLSISSTGFGLAAARAHGDGDTFESLWATAALFGGPVDRDQRRHFAFGGPLGDAMMFALLTARPASSWEVAS